MCQYLCTCHINIDHGHRRNVNTTFNAMSLPFLLLFRGSLLLQVVFYWWTLLMKYRWDNLIVLNVIICKCCWKHQSSKLLIGIANYFGNDGVRVVVDDIIDAMNGLRVLCVMRENRLKRTFKKKKKTTINCAYAYRLSPRRLYVFVLFVSRTDTFV